MDIVRSWKDADYRAQFIDATSNPAGPSDIRSLQAIEMSGFNGGNQADSGVGCLTKTATFTLPPWCIVSLSLC
ncbi:hypothetical protein GCM10027598_46910 [Amycolatopsis oliviviridis]|uniref:Uncharacterized protein n=1 Tax=Amycolatopsis oliviviridis TaxID=1471590 RepID=A0ABQ3MLN2_9PSEU|nr:mersacidin/lichenicidin family type 2 lantibiotic [Amycolatopsis oliviviridis]GHH38576.1 hypothetical protein GCM10017790_84560 [Amycolatopsis oliviviridis]